MKYLWLPGLTALLLPVLAACNDQQIKTVWAPTAVTIDGHAEDWPEGAITFFPDHQLSVGAANDSTHLYLLLRFRDPAWARAIRMSGLSLWINPNNKKDRDIGIKYIGGPDFPNRMEDASRNQQPRRMFTPPEKQLLFIEKARLAEVSIRFDGAMGPAIAFDTSGGFYTYELSIPWQESVAGSYGISLTTGQKYAIGIEWGKMDDRREQMRGNGPPGGGMGGMPGGGPPSGGMGGRPGGGMRPPGGERPKIEEIEYWVKSITAEPNEEE